MEQQKEEERCQMDVSHLLFLVFVLTKIKTISQVKLNTEHILKKKERERYLNMAVGGFEIYDGCII